MAFAGSQIEKVIFQNDCKLEHASFQDCAFLKEVSILNGKLDCGHTVFEGCRCLNHIDFKKIQLTKNSEKLFKDCGFTKVVLPAH
ncbi:hypothetical protein FACS1894166_09750 [Bacilli bacterium]|nr:hypothetical protein FACS1894166_09750 [Bacilli bacterium]